MQTLESFFKKIQTIKSTGKLEEDKKIIKNILDSTLNLNIDLTDIDCSRIIVLENTEIEILFCDKFLDEYLIYIKPLTKGVK